MDLLGRRKGSDHFADLKGQFLGERRLIVVVIVELAVKGRQHGKGAGRFTYGLSVTKAWTA